MKTHLFIICICVFLACMQISCDEAAYTDNGPSYAPASTNTPQEMFKAIIIDPIPEGISNIEGVGDTWQGYQLFLRFYASNDVIDAIIQQGYQTTTWAEVADIFKLPNIDYNQFSPNWAPNAIDKKECYALKTLANGWTHHGSHYLVIDRAKGLVYFLGHGG